MLTKIGLQFDWFNHKYNNYSIGAHDREKKK